MDRFAHNWLMNVMLVILEVLVVAYVCYVAWRILRNSFAHNVLMGLAVLTGFGMACLVSRLAGILFGWAVGNPLILALMAVTLSTVAFFITVHLLGREIRKRRRRPAGRLTQRVSGALNLFLVALLLVGVIALVDFMVSLASYSEVGDEIREGTLYLKYFLPVDQSGEVATSALPCPDREADAVSEESLTEIMDKQAHFAELLRSGFNSSKESLAKRLGAQGVLEQVKALQFVVNLPPEESAWLVEQTPELVALGANKHLQDVMSDPRILDLVIRAGEGSMSAIYELSKDAVIRDLLADPTIADGIRGLDLQRMQQLVLNHRRELEAPDSGEGR